LHFFYFHSTIVVEPGCTARITQYGDVEIMVSKCFSGIKYAFQLHNFMLQVGQDIKRHLGPELDTIRLSVFSHRFMSIAEQMGRVLQRSSISTNIKERLDFSCALFGPDGGLVANAPHIPVHLGAMQYSVQWQVGFDYYE
jgi:5-oxoprolinase (ATP-hydrolysing)